MDLTTAHVALAAVTGGLIGWLTASGLDRRRLAGLSALRDRERQESDRELGALRRELADTRQRWQEQLEAFPALPELVHELFQVSSRRAVVPLLLRMIDALLRPEQAAVFVARPAVRKLALAEGVGLTKTLHAGVEVDYGQGRVGYVAENRVAMDDGDFKGARGESTDRALDVKRQLGSSELPDLRADAVAPVLDKEAAFAVLTVGGARVRRGLEKRLLGMVADLAAVAVVHADRRQAFLEGSAVDGMTGLLNRQAIEQRVDAAILAAERGGTRASVLMLDLDDFRRYNQTNGHQQGDEVIRRLAALLRGSVRADDFVGRFGGEEFLVVFVGADKVAAMRLAEELRARVEAFPFAFRGLQPQGCISVSGGVATWPEDSRVGRELVRCADQAMLEAKREGRNRVLPAEPNYIA